MLPFRALSCVFPSPVYKCKQRTTTLPVLLYEFQNCFCVMWVPITTAWCVLELRMEHNASTFEEQLRILMHRR